TAAVTSGFAGIDAVTGTGTLTGENLASAWALSGTPTYTDGTTTLAISGFVTLQAGSGGDTFTVNAPSTFNLKGGTGDDVFDLGATLTGTLDGGSGTDTLKGGQIT